MKALKDPLYGYINIDDELFDKIIDSPEFQRLRGITQTSYAPLYASAVHNRFVHSLGVFYLGKIVSKTINNLELDITNKNRWLQIFELACLLHDVGHAPFSHTGENFYLPFNGSRDKLHTQIFDITNDTSWFDDIKSKDYKAAPHELMSVLVALRNYSELFETSEEASFFARCIVGYLYEKDIDKEKSFLNCLILLLNSSIIDVDKLDYLIRDAYITGYDTISIDYERLLKNITIIEEENNTFKLVYTQGAISVIENVVFAHDSERKWIQNHPIVQYDSYLLKHSIELLESKYSIFKYDTLTKTGVRINDDLNISLMTDGDVLFLMKNIITDNTVNEYFCRNERRHPLWKSESEYKAIFNPAFSSNAYNILEDKIEGLVKYLSSINGTSEISSSSYQAVIDDIEKSKDKFKDHPKTLSEKNNYLKLIECFKKFADEQNIEFDFLIITAKQFNSGFDKVDFEKIEIKFSSLNNSSLFKTVSNPLCSKLSDRDKFFYMFYRRKNRETEINVSKLVQELNSWAVEQAYLK